MGRTGNWQANPWGRTLDSQRTDLWTLEFASSNFKTFFPTFDDVDLYACEVDVPELKIRAEAVKRNSCSYLMPSWDVPLDPIRVVFLHDAGKGDNSSRIAQFLHMWRGIVRSGRGSISEETNYDLNEKLSIPRFDLQLTLYRGGNIGNVAVQSVNYGLDLAEIPPPPSSPFSLQSSFSTPSSAAPLLPGFGFEEYVARATALEVSSRYRVKGAWLSGFKHTAPYSYAQCTMGTITASICVENVELVTRDSGAGTDTVI